MAKDKRQHEGIPDPIPQDALPGFNVGGPSVSPGEGFESDGVPPTQELPHLRRIWFNNFKGFDHLEASLARFNVLVGPNNAGKSSVLQGINLLYSLLKLHAADERGLNTTSGRIVPVTIFPVANQQDLFFRRVARRGNVNVVVKIGGEFDFGGIVEFDIKSLFGGLNSKLVKFSGVGDELVQTLIDKPATWVPSSTGIVRDEEFRTPARRVGLISTGRHNEILRNLLIELQQDRPSDFELLQRILRERFGAQIKAVDFNPLDDQFVTANYGDDSAVHDLFSAGSGFVQIVQLLAFILARDPSVVLLDEPDAHLHSSLQQIVVEILEEVASARGFQVILATHSKEIINFVDPTRLLWIERGKRHASPVSDAVTPMTILRSLGPIDNVDAYTLVSHRRCLFVEGPTDATILGRFAATLGIRALTGNDRVVTVPVGGADRFEHVKQLDVFESILGQPIKSLEIRDRDGRVDADREGLMAGSKRPLHILELDCIESYLLNPEVITRCIKEALADRGRTADVEIASVVRLLEEASEELKDAAFDHICDRYASEHRNDRPTPAVLNAQARAALDVAWGDLSSRLKFVPGKQLLGRVQAKIQERYGANFGNERLAESFRADEVPQELAELLRRVAELQGSKVASDPQGPPVTPTEDQ